jgi:thiamine biosynthesis lipoprotein
MTSSRVAKHFYSLIILAALVVGISSEARSQGEAKKVLKLMGCRFEITAVGDNDTIAWEAVNAGIDEITRIEKLISSWDPNSQTSEINDLAGIRPVKVDRELYDLIYRAGKVSKLTHGAFDISFASMDKIYQFDSNEKPLPDSASVAEARLHIDFNKIILNSEETTVFLSEKGMRIGFGGIGKGYAANMAKKKMLAIEGISGGVVNASGDLLAWGESTSAEGWLIKIANPGKEERMIGWLQIEDMAVVTSGDYEKYFTSKGRRYAHIIDPRTGYPTHGVTSVTIVCPDAELADALATSVFVLGVSEGLQLINQLNGIECIIIDDAGSIHQSQNLNLNYY